MALSKPRAGSRTCRTGRKRSPSLWPRSTAPLRCCVFWSHRLKAWTVASQPFLVPNPSCVGQQGFRCETSESLTRPPAGGLRPSGQGYERSTRNQRDGMLPSATIQTTVCRERVTSSLLPGKPPLTCSGRRPVSERTEARETGAIGRSFLLAVSSTRGGG